MKTTMAKFDPATGAPIIHYEDIDISLVAPRKRDYSSSKGAK